MDLFGTMAIAACLGSLAAKWFFACRCKHLEKQLNEKREACQEARREMTLAANQHKILIAEQKQLNSRRTTIQRNLGHLNKVYQKFVDEETLEQAVKTQQAELLREIREKSG